MLSEFLNNVMFNFINGLGVVLVVSLENITTYLNSFKLHAADISLFICKMQDLFSMFSHWLT